jgi:hypothetical protein
MTLEETNSVSGKEPDNEETILNATAGEYIKLDDSSAEIVRDLDNRIVQCFYQYNFATNKKQYTLGYDLLENDLVATLEAYDKNGYFQELSEKLNRCEVVTLINFAENLPGNYVKEFTLDDNKTIYRSYISFPIRYSGNDSLGTEFPYYVGGDTLYELWLYWLYTPQKNEYVLYSWAEVIPDTKRITWFIPNEVIISDFTPYAGHSAYIAAAVRASILVTSCKIELTCVSKSLLSLSGSASRSITAVTRRSIVAAPLAAFAFSTNSSSATGQELTVGFSALSCCADQGPGPKCARISSFHVL